ncbi:MAG TPA: hypothetical protein VFU15_08895, partial [Bacteroidia bacterium]|nr:hypothetical protein [Bacteroidia bacterium]
MRKFLPAGFLLLSLSCAANSGGPDAFGYTWKDNNEPGGPAYQWYEISTTGTQVNGLGDDNFVGPIQIGFQFRYYWYQESKVWIGSNGYVEFGPGNLAANFPSIPDPTGVNNYIGGIVSDLTFLDPTNPGKVFYKSLPDSFVVEYQNVPYWDANPPYYNQASSNTFEIILNRVDSSITVNFQSYSGTSFSNYTSGIENNIGNMGLQPLAYQPPQQAYTLKYYYPINPPAVTDAGVDWNYMDGDGGIFLASQGAPYTLVT